MRKRREEMERDEHAEILRQIDAEFDTEHNKLLEQRKQVAEQNRVSLLKIYKKIFIEYHCTAKKD